MKRNPKDDKLKKIIRGTYGTQADFCLIVNEDESYVSRVVNGRKKLPEDKQRLWAKKLGCTVAELFS